MSVACHNGVALPHSDTWIDSSSSNVETSPPVKVYLCTPSEWRRARRRAVHCTAHSLPVAWSNESLLTHGPPCCGPGAAAARTCRRQTRCAARSRSSRTFSGTTASPGGQCAQQPRPHTAIARKHARIAADLHGGAAGGVLRGVRVGAGRAVVVAVRQREALAEACTRSTPFPLPSTWWLTDTGEIRCRRL